ncbi:MAG: hypothetical protein LBR27_09670 [Bifidobacteriaceae bacterium]|jgi:hypothetical protein|nr:hypothetical protein [Bifidobacteriaceae bacterium]
MSPTRHRLSLISSLAALATAVTLIGAPAALGQTPVAEGLAAESAFEAPAIPTLSLSSYSWTAPAEGEGISDPVTVSTNQDSWQITSSPPWVNTSSGEGGDGSGFTISVGGPNNTGFYRTGPIVIQAGSITRVLVVSQAAITLTLSPGTTYIAPVAGGSRASTVTTNAHSWSAEADADWVTVSPTSGATGDRLTVTAEPNSGAARSATVSVTAAGYTKTFRVTQIQVTFAVSPTYWEAPLEGGGASPHVTVTTPYDTWQITRYPDWVMLSSLDGSSGSGFTVSATSTNPGPLRRSGAIVIQSGGRTLTYWVYQAAVTLSVSPAAWVAPVAGGTREVTVTTNYSDWSAAADADWLTISPTSGSSGGKFTITAQPNSGAARSATVTVTAANATRTLRVTQAAVVFAVSPATWEAPLEGGGASPHVTVTTPYGDWQIIKKPSWVMTSADSGTSGSGFTVNALSANPNPVRRTDTIIIRSGVATRLFVVTQPAVTLTLNPAVLWVAPVAGSTRTVTVTTNAASWSVESDAAWLTVSPSSGSTGEQFTMTAQANTGAARSATVSVTAYGLTRTIRVTQAAITFTVSPSSWTAPLDGSGASPHVTVTTPYSSWTITSKPAWVITSSDSGTSGGGFTVNTTGPNLTRLYRAAPIVIQSGSQIRTYMVYQAAVTLSVSPAVLWVAPKAGGTRTITVTTNGYVWWAESSAESWLHITPDPTGPRFTITADANTTGASRTATVTVFAYSSALTRTITVTQPR